MVRIIIVIYESRLELEEMLNNLNRESLKIG